MINVIEEALRKNGYRCVGQEMLQGQLYLTYQKGKETGTVNINMKGER